MERLKQKYEQLCATPSDINEHLPTLKEYAEKCEHITEMGVRGVVSTYAFLMGKPKKLVGYDIGEYKENVAECREIAKEANLEWEFILEDVLKANIEETDFLFIDTFHTKTQLERELQLHASKVRRYIGFHDTTTFETCGENSYESVADKGTNCGLGIWFAIEDFLNANPNWKIVYRATNNNGLTIIEKF